MATEFKSKKQEALFNEITRSGKLIFASGNNGLSANIVGEFKINHFMDKEHRLDMEDGTNHVHIDWNNITKFECGSFHGEGMLTFFNKNETVFKLYRMAGDFSDKIKALEGNLI